MTSRPISSNTSTFHTAPSAEGFVGAGPGSSCASTSVTGAFRFSMRFMLATRRPVSDVWCVVCAPKQWPWDGLPICLSRSVTAMAT